MTDEELKQMKAKTNIELKRLLDNSIRELYNRGFNVELTQILHSPAPKSCVSKTITL